MADRISIDSDELQIAENINIMLGKYQDPTYVNVLHDTSVLKLVLDPKDVIIPSNYKYD